MQRLLLRGQQLTAQHDTKIRFLLVGGVNTAIGLAMFPALYFIAAPLKLHYLHILVIATAACMVIAFLTSKYFVFRTRGNYLREFGRYFTFHFLNFLLNLAALPLLVEVVGMNPVWAQTLFISLVIVTSYFWHSRITFKSIKVDR
jgi:putative flippase GtrA